MKPSEFFKGTQDELAAKERVNKASSINESAPEKMHAGKRMAFDRDRSVASHINRRRGGTAFAALAVIAVAAFSHCSGEKSESDESKKSDDSSASVPVESFSILNGLQNLPKDNFTRIEPIQPKAVGEKERMIEIQTAWKNLSEKALGRFEGADPRVSVLLQFMSEKAYYSIPDGPVVTKYIMPGTSEQERLDKATEGFEIVYMPDKYAAGMQSSILVEDAGKTLRIATMFETEEWLGIIIAHEMSHVHDQLVGGENSKDYSQYMAGEVKAHLFEMKLLKYWNPQAYDRLISEGVVMMRAGNTEGIKSLAVSLYPLQKGLASLNEASLGTASCFLAVVFEEAIQRGATPKQLEQVYSELVRSENAKWKAMKK